MPNLDWGVTRYSEALSSQRQLVERRKAGEISDTLVLTEHHPVYTIGSRVGALQHLLFDEEQCREQGIEVEKTNRGGDITYHGPGQIVAYPIVDWSARKDLHGYLRLLEDVLLQTLVQWDLTGTRREGLTGIWLGNRKIAAIGVAVSRWVTWHGISLNVSPDLSHFAGIVPCGITNGTVTSMKLELGFDPGIEEVKSALVLEFAKVFPTLRV